MWTSACPAPGQPPADPARHRPRGADLRAARPTWLHPPRRPAGLPRRRPEPGSHRSHGRRSPDQPGRRGPDGDPRHAHAGQVPAPVRGGETLAKMKPSDAAKATHSGTVITDALVDELADEAEAGYDLRRAERRQVGRPSLGAGTSPRLQFRVSPDLYAAAEQRARQEGRAVSDIAREALRAYLQEA